MNSDNLTETLIFLLYWAVSMALYLWLGFEVTAIALLAFIASERTTKSRP